MNIPPIIKLTPKYVTSTLKKAITANQWKNIGRRKEESDAGCRAAAYTSMVMSAHTSLGSHPQYLPHDTFAQIAPIKIPAAMRNTAGYKMMWLMICKRMICSWQSVRVYRKMIAVIPFSMTNASSEYESIIVTT